MVKQNTTTKRVDGGRAKVAKREGGGSKLAILIYMKTNKDNAMTFS